MACSRGHEQSKEVTHGSIAPRTAQIGADVAEIDHASHQRDAERHRLSGPNRSHELLLQGRIHVSLARDEKTAFCELPAA